ncbi:hypothetical protein QBC43DRAFT_229546, partial [Cladorrhinum sp. PSN259]
SISSSTPWTRINPLNRPDLGEGNVFTPQVAFKFPPSSSPSTGGPCTLALSFPANYEIVDSSVQAGGQPLPLNFYALDGPAAGSLVGTARLPTFLPDQKTREVVRVVVNSFTCREVQSFRIELGALGELGFVNDNEAGNGLFLEYGC